MYTMPRFKAFTLMLSLATLSATAFGQSANPARPGTLNYVEGQASVEGRQVTPQSVGQTELKSGEYLATATGKAEILLTPGVFLRLGNDSAVKMISPDLTHTEVLLDHGRATVEVDQLYKQNDILIDQKGGQTQLLKNGLYEFNADNNTVRVYDGKAAVYPGDNHATDIKPINVKENHQLALNGDGLKPQGFDKNHSEAGDDLYAWSSLRSNYLGQANLNLASEYAGSSNFTPGWFWDQGLYSYTWLPGDGPFFSPFGYGFYSPYYLYGGGFVYGRGFYGRDFRYGANRAGYGYRGGNAGFRGGNVGVRGGTSAPGHTSGGFSGGGGGGFHGGGAGGGGFHGGGGGGGHR
jgi:hypothetical protein